MQYYPSPAHMAQYIPHIAFTNTSQIYIYIYRNIYIYIYVYMCMHVYIYIYRYAGLLVQHYVSTLISHHKQHMLVYNSGRLKNTISIYGYVLLQVSLGGNDFLRFRTLDSTAC